jgi:CBS-domain-containing membrane protein
MHMHTCIHHTQEDTSLSKVYTLFRQLGLRHLAVIPRASEVAGVITRHDLLPGALEETFLEHVPVGAGACRIVRVCAATVVCVCACVCQPCSCCQIACVC